MKDQDLHIETLITEAATQLGFTKAGKLLVSTFDWYTLELKLILPHITNSLLVKGSFTSLNKDKFNVMFLKFFIIIISPHVKKFMQLDQNSLRWVFNSSTKTFLRRSFTLSHISIRRNARILYKVRVLQQESSYNIFLHRETSS